jgi:U3 small nucleolar ribonucleoprotein component
MKSISVVLVSMLNSKEQKRILLSAGIRATRNLFTWCWFSIIDQNKGSTRIVRVTISHQLDYVWDPIKMDETERKQIEEIEKQLLADKPWQLKGEVSARSRPLNSLLFEDVNYEQRIKAPIITPETTEALEAMIRQRIKDNKFDDPVKKVKPTKPSGPQARQVEISSEKSKVGLAQLYEQELIAKATSSKPARDGPEKEVETKLFALFRKLDALVDR